MDVIHLRSKTFNVVVVGGNGLPVLNFGTIYGICPALFDALFGEFLTGRHLEVFFVDLCVIWETLGRLFITFFRFVRFCWMALILWPNLIF